ncbi:hypothetical protein Phum_PHUM457950 [Pediculus humanus corporis]|uniref:Uncharacterized protein n=1 Tax=Pediculus humanus subsp. corporis TaxID=121224 RepID=E0VV26_PEDHC|nr:uncharacterized protein Phum_PHUM457950 [Pediculus humanus corporis]EEB17232.1 hypothetical protein Phum_PHUM457950 [Pediculus humanus corporis]
MHGSSSSFDSQKKNNKNNSKKITAFPKEIRIYGQFHKLQISKNDKTSDIDIDDSKLSKLDFGTDKNVNKKDYVIVPVNKKDSTVKFIKLPIYKLKNHPKSEKADNIRCKKTSLQDGISTTEILPSWVAKNDKFKNQQKINDKKPTCFVFRQSLAKEPIIRYHIVTLVLRLTMVLYLQ